MPTLGVGIAGAAGRGGAFREPIEAHDDAGIVAVCDTNLDALASTDDFDDYRDVRKRLQGRPHAVPRSIP